MNKTIQWVGAQCALAIIVACISIGFAEPSEAACTPDPALNGDAVTCTGVDADGFKTRSQNVSLYVDSTANVSRVQIEAYSTITNDGIIEYDGTYHYNAVNAESYDNTIINNNIIATRTTSNSSHISGIRLNARNTVINLGTIIASETGPTGQAFGIWGSGSSNTI